MFRKPAFPLIFCALIGAGVHIVACFYFALMSTIQSSASPLSYASQWGIWIIAFPCFSLLNGYTSARLYKFFNGTHWIILSLITCTGLSAFLMFSLTVIHLCEYVQTGSIMSDIYVLLIIWISFNVPGTLIGTFFGFS